MEPVTACQYFNKSTSLQGRPISRLALCPLSNHIPSECFHLLCVQATSCFPATSILPSSLLPPLFPNAPTQLQSRWLTLVRLSCFGGLCTLLQPCAPCPLGYKPLALSFIGLICLVVSAASCPAQGSSNRPVFRVRVLPATNDSSQIGVRTCQVHHQW